MENALSRHMRLKGKGMWLVTQEYSQSSGGNKRRCCFADVEAKQW